MNTAQEIITYAGTHGIDLIIRDDRLVIDAPKNELTDEFLDTAKEHKSEIISALTERWNPELSAEGYQWCFDCQHWNAFERIKTYYDPDKKKSAKKLIG